MRLSENDDGTMDIDSAVSRREMLQKMGKYSAIAAFVLASPTFLLQGCVKKKSSTGPDDQPPPDGSSFEKAIPIAFGQSAEATVKASSSSMMYFKFVSTQQLIDALANISLVSFIGGTVARCSLLNPSQVVLDTLEFTDAGVFNFDVSASTYYLRFEAIQGGGILGFSLVDHQPNWSNYNDWNNYSDSWSNYSDSWSNYSDSWSNYSDYGAWGNWMESW